MTSLGIQPNVAGVAPGSNVLVSADLSGTALAVLPSTLAGTNMATQFTSINGQIQSPIVKVDKNGKTSVVDLAPQKPTAEARKRGIWESIRNTAPIPAFQPLKSSDFNAASTPGLGGKAATSATTDTVGDNLAGFAFGGNRLRPAWFEFRHDVAAAAANNQFNPLATVNNPFMNAMKFTLWDVNTEFGAGALARGGYQPSTVTIGGSSTLQADKTQVLCGFPVCKVFRVLSTVPFATAVTGMVADLESTVPYSQAVIGLTDRAAAMVSDPTNSTNLWSNSQRPSSYMAGALTPMVAGSDLFKILHQYELVCHVTEWAPTHEFLADEDFDGTMKTLAALKDFATRSSGIPSIGLKIVTQSLYETWIWAPMLEEQSIGPRNELRAYASSVSGAVNVGSVSGQSSNLNSLTAGYASLGDQCMWDVPSVLECVGIPYKSDLTNPKTANATPPTEPPSYKFDVQLGYAPQAATLSGTAITNKGFVGVSGIGNIPPLVGLVQMTTSFDLKAETASAETLLLWQQGLMRYLLAYVFSYYLSGILTIGLLMESNHFQGTGLRPLDLKFSTMPTYRYWWRTPDPLDPGVHPAKSRTPGMINSFGPN